MGKYATTTSLQILMVGTNFDAATIALCTKLITHAENEINKFLSKRYNISVFTTTSMPPLITSWCESLTEGYMYQRMSRGSKESMDRSKTLIDQVVLNLTAVSEYKLDLEDANGIPVVDFSNTAYQVLSTTDDYIETFDEDDPTNWVVDSDKIDDIQGDKD